MAERAPDHRTIASQLPAIYEEDPGSHAQVAGYLGLFDDLDRAYLAQLDDLTTWLSPEAQSVQPPGLAAGEETGPAHEAAFAELADWFAFRFPGSWRAIAADEPSLRERQRQFLLRAARLWRRRGTPRGFHAWFCFYFDLSPPASGNAVDTRPILIEHFRYRPPSVPAEDDPYALRVTMLVPLTGNFREYRRRREAQRFVSEHAPAHLVTRLCWVVEGFEKGPPAFDLQNVTDVRSVLERIASFVPLDDGIHLEKAGEDPDPLDLLGGALPGAGA